MLKCVHDTIVKVNNFFSMISQFGAQYDNILENLRSLPQIGSVHNEVN